MIVNLSNHPKSNWSHDQIEAALPYGTIIDLPFPEIDPDASEETVTEIACKFLEEIMKMLKDSREPLNAVHLMGEMTFCFTLGTLLLEKGIPCIASTTRREVFQNGASKTSVFTFCRFRKYKLP